LKNILTIFLTVICLHCFGQVDTIINPKPTPNRDTVKPGAIIARPVDSAQLRARRLANALRRDSLRKDSISRGLIAIDSLHTDSTLTDSARLAFNRRDSLRRDSIKADSTRKALAAKNAAPPGKEGDVRVAPHKEDLFYILAGLLLFLGFVKVAYTRYFQNIFKLFFQTSLRQKQTPEQIVQGYVPGFLLTLLFFIVGGMFIAIYAEAQSLLKGPLWMRVLFCSGVFACIYLVKYLVTLFAGLVFNVKEAAGTYSFIVFLVNRVMAIILLPLLIMLAFYGGDARAVLFTITASIVVILLMYRYILSLTVIRKNLKVSALHFFIYLCAVELMPLLVIYKVLFIEIAKNK